MTEVEVTVNGAVLEVCLTNPPANALTAPICRAIGEAFMRLRDDNTLRVGIFGCGGNRIFCAGWDLKELASRDSFSLSDMGPGGYGGFTELFDLCKPIVCAVNGMAVGGGFELVLACDVIVASEHSEFFLPEVARGILPDAGAVQILGHRIPYYVAMDMLLTGRRMNAAEAARWGLVNYLTPRDQALAKARHIANHIAESAPLAVQAVKESVRHTFHLGIEDAFRKMKMGKSGLPIYERMLRSEDFLEGARAFAEKRKPVWKGR